MRPRACAVALAACCVAVAPMARAELPAPLSTPPPLRAHAPDRAARSALFDAGAADDARARQQPQYVERIVVEGRDPDARRPKPRSVEQRFAEALLAPPPSPLAGLRMLDTTPCMSVLSTRNDLGNSYAPITGCP
ncbi:MAG: hypothetical protein IPM22_03590 [Betaproteobacteria bacterium]|nr:hypothetical protein [Betaproteobacteria bacterium]